MSDQTAAGAAQGAPLTLSRLVDDYFTQYAGRDDSRVPRLAWWVEILGDRPAEKITDDDVFAGLELLAETTAGRYAGRDVNGKKIFRPRREKRSSSTVNRYHVALGALFSWAIDARRMPKGWKNPCREIRRRREPAGIVRFLSAPERESLLEACRASNWDRLYLLVLLAVTTGARRGELVGLRWRDIDFERACAYVVATKNGDRRVLPLTSAAIAELQRHRGGASSLLFASPEKPAVAFNFEDAWRLARARAKLAEFRFHDLRHTCASYLAQNGASLLEIADVMGHRTLTMVKRYAHLTVASKTSVINRVLGDIR